MASALVSEYTNLCYDT